LDQRKSIGSISGGGAAGEAGSENRKTNQGVSSSYGEVNGSPKSKGWSVISMKDDRKRIFAPAN
jgi:hypothetical protein